MYCICPACVCVQERARARERERVIVCFRLSGSSHLLCSVFSRRRCLGDKDWEKLCLGAVGGFDAHWLDASFQKPLSFKKHSMRMTSSSAFQQQRWWEIPKGYLFLKKNGRKRFSCERKPVNKMLPLHLFWHTFLIGHTCVHPPPTHTHTHTPFPP